MKQLKVFFLIFSFIIISCQENKSKERNPKSDVTNEIIGHTFFKVTETQKGRVLYKPCDANIAKYKIYRDSIFHNWGQEYYTYNIKSIKNSRSQITYETTYKYNNENPDTSDSLIIFKKIEKSNGYWKINGDVFLDSLYINTLSHVNQPCSECDNCEDNSFNNAKSNLEKWYGRYQVLLNEDKEWEDQINITIDIKKDSIVYEASGYQIFERYLLKKNKTIGEDNILKLYFDKVLDGSKSFLLEKNENFGTMIFNGKNLTWKAAYIDARFNNEIKTTYVMEKN